MQGTGLDRLASRPAHASTTSSRRRRHAGRLRYAPLLPALPAVRLLALFLTTGLFWLIVPQAIIELLGLFALFTGSVALMLSPRETDMGVHVPMDHNPAQAKNGDNFVSGLYTLCAATVGTLIMLFLLK